MYNKLFILLIIKYSMSKIKVQIVYPEFPDTFWSFRESLKYVGKKWVM